VDRGHSGREGQRLLGLLPQPQPVLEDFLVGAVEARIDETLGAARALANTKVEVRKIGGFNEPSDSTGSKPWPIIRVAGLSW
jgi:hypothetical protein